MKDFSFGEMVVVFLLGVCIGILLLLSIAKREAIAHHAAHYDTLTGKWQWNQEDK